MAASSALDTPSAPLPLPLGQASELGPIDAFLSRFVAETIRAYNEAPADEKEASIAESAGTTEAGRGRRIVRRAAAFSAFSGAAVGLVTTGSAALTAGTQGVGAIVAAPTAAVSIAIETVMRLRTHVRMACRLADLFDVRFDPSDPADVWALFTLALGTERTPAERHDPAQTLTRFAQSDLGDLAKGLGGRLFSEGLLRSAVPVVGVVSSSVTNYLVTRKLGEVARRYMRYRRAFSDALEDPRLRPLRSLLVEGLWFLFAADGRLLPEETALLATALRGGDATLHENLAERLADPIGWYLRLREVPKEARAPLYHALEIGAAVDTHASLGERKLLERAAEALGLRYDEARLERMIDEIGAVGMLYEQVSEDKAAILQKAA